MKVNRIFASYSFLFSALAMLAMTAGSSMPAFGETKWYRGNTHTHTTNSDGDSSPEDVGKWYRAHGYDFLFITDHDLITDAAPLNERLSNDGQFLVIKGEEVSSNFSASMRIHVNALNPSSVIKPQLGANAREAAQKDVNLINSAGGIAQINHPNYFWGLNADDIASIKGATLLEIANMHPGVNSFGAGPAFPSAETIWDRVLSRGVRIWGVASDDMHQLKEISSKDPITGARPGRGWIMARAKELSVDAIMNALREGDFYASTGVVIDDYQRTKNQIAVKLKPDVRKNRKYRVQFIGKKGRVLQDSVGDSAAYRIKGNEFYVRVRITDSNGRKAWTQPVFVGKR